MPDQPGVSSSAGSKTPESHGLPEKFVARLGQILPPGALSSVLASYRMPRAVGFRVNPLLAESGVVDDLMARGFLARQLDWLPEAWLVPFEQRAAFLSDEAVQAGHVYVQNASSMVPVWALDPQPGDTVMDLAAAPGSKTLQIAGRMMRDGELAAVEIVKKRFYRMKALLKKNGAAHVRTFHQDGTRVHRYRPEHFNRILLDAPCSTEGRFVAGDESTTRYWSERKIQEMAYRQRQLAESAVNCLRPGGVLVYATCTTAPEENEALVDWLLNRFSSSLSVEPIAIPSTVQSPIVPEWNGVRFADDVNLAVRILPSEEFESFFVCRFRKSR